MSSLMRNIVFISVALFCLFLITCSDGGSSGTDDNKTDGDSEISNCPTGMNCVPCSSNIDCNVGEICDMSLKYCVKTGIIDGDFIDTDTNTESDIENNKDDTDGRTIEVSPLVLEFGNVQIGNSATERITVRNSSMSKESLKVNKIEFLGGGDKIDFTFTTLGALTETEITLPTTLEPDSGFFVDVKYSPSDEVDDDNMQVQILSNDSDSPGVKVDLKPQYKGIPTLVIDPDPLTLEDTPIFSSTIIDIKLKNEPVDPDANRVLKISDIYLKSGKYADAPFLVKLPENLTEQAPKYLAPHESFTISLEFSPEMMSVYKNTLYVESSDPAKATAEFPIIANCIAADLLVDPSPLDYGIKDLGNSYPAQITITNVGLDDFDVEDVTLFKSSSAFEITAIDPALPWNMKPKDVGTIDVKFTPAVDVEYRDKLWIHTGDTKPDYFSEIIGSGRENTAPVAELRANGKTEDSNSAIGQLITLDDDGVYDDGVGSYDPDKDQIIDWDFQIENAPPGHASIKGTSNMRTVAANVAGDWIFSLRIKDKGGTWSIKDTVTVTVKSGPTAVLKAHVKGADHYPPSIPVARAGSQVVLDLSESNDPDGGKLQEYEIEVDTWPSGGDPTLIGTDSRSQTSTPDKEGRWVYTGRVKDDDDIWSPWVSINVDVIPPETLTVIMGDANTCDIPFLKYHLYFYNPNGDACGYDTTSTWGPHHTGGCSGTGGNKGAEVIIWDYSEFNGKYPYLDGEYVLEIQREIGFADTIEMHIRKDASSTDWWEAKYKFKLLDPNRWQVLLKRQDGEWQIPHTCDPARSTPSGCSDQSY